MESCDADVLEIGGDEVDNKVSVSVQQLTAKVETGTSLQFLPAKAKRLKQTTGSTWLRGHNVQQIPTTTPTT